MSLFFRSLLCLAALFATHSRPLGAAELESASARQVDYAREIQPLLAKHCYACHGPDEAESGLHLSERDSVFGEADSGDAAVVPGDSESSQLILRVTSDDEYERMPPEDDPLDADDIELLRRWIDQGAAWEKYWAFEPVQPVAPPQVESSNGSTHPIDALLSESLANAGLQPNEPADRRTLIRRAYYDLTGLPPSIQQVEAFVQDDRPDAFAHLVDELLESPHYGERWGRHWLDLVRFAETNSFERDGIKPNAWKYRDYVIESFNQDKPYDQFVLEQLAGDELDEVTDETLTATGYYRLGIWDDEPADPLQAKFDEVDDLITTTGQVFLGLTINCARCHDHKIDPIPQTDYYSLVAFFADVTSYGKRSDPLGNNQIDISPADLKQRYAESDQRIRDAEQRMTEIEQAGIATMAAADQRATEGPKRDRQHVLKEHLRDHLSDEQWADYETAQAELTDLERAREQLPPRETVLGLATCLAEPPATHLLIRGNPHVPGDVVEPSFPELFEAAIPSLPAPAENASSAGRRRVLADWVVDADNRLTARVMANRLWQYHFGRGIVRSSNNFGMLGTPPTHPELLDWLASELVAGGWKLKPMHRLIMSSRAYQMSSETTDDGLAQDPNNDLFWRFDPRRLSAEEVRDSILAVNGSLNRTVAGPSIYPALSAEVLAGQSRPGSGWGDSTADERNRRSVYIHVKRSLITPLLEAFDFPEPDRSCEARFSTLQPGQALSLLNSAFIHDQASQLAVAVDGAAELPDRQFIERVLEATLARSATPAETTAGVELISELQADFHVSPQHARQLFCLTVLNWNEFLFVD